MSAATILAAAGDLDSVLPGAVFDLVKIDVQGYEPDVLQGMMATLARSPAPVVVAEFWPAALRDRGLEPTGVLRGYAALGLGPIGVQIGADVQVLDPIDIMRLCAGGGEAGQVNLVLGL
ncbi:MAG: FkbM family methyltransferase [Dermatophilaceae bacterium]